MSKATIANKSCFGQKKNTFSFLLNWEGLSVQRLINISVLSECEKFVNEQREQIVPTNFFVIPEGSMEFLPSSRLPYIPSRSKNTYAEVAGEVGEAGGEQSPNWKGEL